LSLSNQLLGGVASLIGLARARRLADLDGWIARLAFETGSEACSFVFGERIGVVEPGAVADLVVHDFVPGESGRQVWPDVLIQAGSSPVAWTVVGGQVLVREGRLLSIDHLELAEEARRTLQAVWSRVGLDFGLPARAAS
jgi:cytosine/adenosine deaminase-related metal-dependent hydrolase